MSKASTWITAGKIVLAVLALGTVVGSALDDYPPSEPPSSDQITFGVLTFLSVVVLHWLLWRFIVPSRRGAADGSAAFFPPRESQCRAGFYRGVFQFGYISIFGYSVGVAGYVIRADWGSHVGSLVFGLSLIGLGMAVRLREAFAALESRAWEPPEMEPRVHLERSATLIHAQPKSANE